SFPALFSFGRLRPSAVETTVGRRRTAQHRGFSPGLRAAAFHCRHFAHAEGVLLMKIAQIAPLFESVPPRLYGGTERVVAYLTEELVNQGHHVTLFASADSVTTAELVPCSARALRLDPTVRDAIPHFMLMLDQVQERADEVD